MTRSHKRGFFAAILYLLVAPKAKPEPPESSSVTHARSRLKSIKEELAVHEAAIRERGLTEELKVCTTKLLAIEERIDVNRLNSNFDNIFGKNTFYNFTAKHLDPLIDKVRIYEKPVGFGMEVINHMQTLDIDPQAQPKQWISTASHYIADTILADFNAGKPVKAEPESIGFITFNAHGYVCQQLRQGQPF